MKTVKMKTPLAALALALALSGPAAQARVGMDSTELTFTPIGNSGPKVCPPGQLASGINGTQPTCVPVTAGCQAGQVMTGLNNGAATCVDTNQLQNNSCPPGEVLQSISNGQTQCVPVVPTTFSAGCPEGQVLQGFSGGEPQCVVQPGAGAGALKFATGTGCEACPNGSFPYPGQGYACNVKDEQGNIRPPTGGTFWICQTLQGQAQAFSFWTY